MSLAHSSEMFTLAGFCISNNSIDQNVLLSLLAYTRKESLEVTFFSCFYVHKFFEIAVAK